MVLMGTEPLIGTCAECGGPVVGKVVRRIARKPAKHCSRRCAERRRARALKAAADASPLRSEQARRTVENVARARERREAERCREWDEVLP